MLSSTNQAKISPLSEGVTTYDEFLSCAKEMLDKHPFNELNSEPQISLLLPYFLGLSMAFPYLQAGSQLKLVFDAIDKNIDISEHIEITSVVGNFLCWDETGGGYVIKKFGQSGLPKILDTKEWFHASLLRHDIERLTGKQAVPNFAEPSRSYLSSLHQGLSDNNPSVRCAYMVAFEVHAHAVIESLWRAICKNFDCKPDELAYFTFHIGGDDPAEVYHVEMVQKMVNKLIPSTEKKFFLANAIKALQENLNWCAKISNL